MTQPRLFLSAAGNTVVPSYLALVGKGYLVEAAHPGQDHETWRAEKDGRRFQGGNPVELPGLITMVELRGPDSRAGDVDIDAFLGKYGGQAS